MQIWEKQVALRCLPRWEAEVLLSHPVLRWLSDWLTGWQEDFDSYACKQAAVFLLHIVRFLSPLTCKSPIFTYSGIIKRKIGCSLHLHYFFNDNLNLVSEHYWIVLAPDAWHHSPNEPTPEQSDSRVGDRVQSHDKCLLCDRFVNIVYIYILYMQIQLNLSKVFVLLTTQLSCHCRPLAAAAPGRQSHKFTTICHSEEASVLCWSWIFT